MSLIQIARNNRLRALTALNSKARTERPLAQSYTRLRIKAYRATK